MHSAIASVATGREARGGRRLGEGALATSVAPESGRNRIMIYGPKPDGTYEIEFQTADGETLAISVPAGETRVLKHFQARIAGRSVRNLWRAHLFPRRSPPTIRPKNPPA